MFKVCSNNFFNHFVTFLIIANTYVLACDRWEIEKEELFILSICNDFFTWAFVMEMAIKLTGLGFKEYAKDSFNLFDAVVVILSLVEVVMEISEIDGGSVFSALRAVRLLRVFKLARSWKTFRELL
jgi:voltage-gated cation channel